MRLLEIITKLLKFTVNSIYLNKFVFYFDLSAAHIK